MRSVAHPWAMVLLILIAPIEAAARGKDPRVPPGTDAGGIAIALISTGIDYTLPHITARLARDGEGELIGWDFADDDALPYEPAGAHRHGTTLASLLLTEAPDARLVPVRIDLEQPASLARALAFVGQTPARVVVLSSRDFGLEHRDQLRQAALHLSHLLIIVDADENGSDVANLLIVTADNAYGAELDVEMLPSGETGAAQPSPGVAALIEAAAKASEIAASEPELDGAGLKRVVLERLAK